jgi:hypothetical protein
MAQGGGAPLGMAAIGSGLPVPPMGMPPHGGGYGAAADLSDLPELDMPLQYPSQQYGYGGSGGMGMQGMGMHDMGNAYQQQGQMGGGNGNMPYGMGMGSMGGMGMGINAPLGMGAQPPAGPPPMHLQQQQQQQMLLRPPPPFHGGAPPQAPPPPLSALLGSLLSQGVLSATGGGGGGGGGGVMRGTGEPLRYVPLVLPCRHRSEMRASRRRLDFLTLVSSAIVSPQKDVRTRLVSQSRRSIWFRICRGAAAGVGALPMGTTFGATALRERHDAVVAALYDDMPRQCRTCGLRVRPARRVFHRARKPWLRHAAREPPASRAPQEDPQATLSAPRSLPLSLPLSFALARLQLRRAPLPLTMRLEPHPTFFLAAADGGGVRAAPGLALRAACQERLRGGAVARVVCVRGAVAGGSGGDDACGGRAPRRWGGWTPRGGGGGRGGRQHPGGRAAGGVHAVRGGVRGVLARVSARALPFQHLPRLSEAARLPPHWSRRSLPFIAGEALNVLATPTHRLPCLGPTPSHC